MRRIKVGSARQADKPIVGTAGQEDRFLFDGDKFAQKNKIVTLEAQKEDVLFISKGDKSTKTIDLDKNTVTTNKSKQVAKLDGFNNVDASNARQSVTILGNEDNNKLVGSRKADTIRGQDGADTIWGGAGRDKLFGHTYTDFSQIDLTPQKGYAEDGANVIYGGSGNDTITGGGGTDHIWGRGAEKASSTKAHNGRAETNTLFGGWGQDYFYIESSGNGGKKKGRVEIRDLNANDDKDGKPNTSNGKEMAADKLVFVVDSANDFNVLQNWNANKHGHLHTGWWEEGGDNGWNNDWKPKPLNIGNFDTVILHHVPIGTRFGGEGHVLEMTDVMVRYDGKNMYLKDFQEDYTKFERSKVFDLFGSDFV